MQGAWGQLLFPGSSPGTFEDGTFIPSGSPRPLRWGGGLELTESSGTSLLTLNPEGLRVDEE